MSTAVFLTIIFFIFVVIVLLVILPFIKPHSQNKRVLTISENINNKDAILTTLNEIEFDFKMNKLSQEDYLVMKDKYTELALKVMKNHDQKLQLEMEKEPNLSDISTIDDEIEAELYKLKQKSSR